MIPNPQTVDGASHGHSVGPIPTPVRGRVPELQALVRRPCARRGDYRAGEDLCTSAALQKRFGEDNVTFDATTWTYLVTIAPGVEQRIVFDKLKKMPGTAVSSRYIDLLSYEDFTFLTSQVADTKALDEVVGRPALLQSWSFGRLPGDSVAHLDPVLGLSGLVGAGAAWCRPVQHQEAELQGANSLDFDLRPAKRNDPRRRQMGETSVRPS